MKLARKEVEVLDFQAFYEVENLKKLLNKEINNDELSQQELE